MSAKPINVLIGGEAGQGLVTVGELLARGLVRSGYHIVVTQDYMSRIRGGHNTFAIRVSADPVAAPSETVDLLVALNAETVALHRGEMAPGGLILADEAFGLSGENLLNVPYKDLAAGRYANTAALGVAGAALGLKRDVLARGLEKAFGKKHPEVVEKNLEALDKSYAWCPDGSCSSLGLPEPKDAGRRLIMTGNEAIALGALAAGVKFCAFYPMTPSTSVALSLADRAEKMGLVVEQAEDEIAAINMALGAAYAGAPSLVPTSGGGYALMVEGISLAAMTETPVVVALIQRPGPATGLPTRTAQADLEFVLGAGHGEFPRAVYAPGTVEASFHLAVKAFQTAEASQGPVFILGDQFLADSFRAVGPFDLEAVTAVNPAAAHDALVETPYLRYRITDSGVSSRLLPGRSEHLVVVDGDEHTEDGHLTEDLAVAQAMMDKRRRKEALLRQGVVPPELDGPDPADLLLVCWGSTWGAALEAAEGARAEGRAVAVLHFSQVWPLVPDQFLPILRRVGRVAAVEGNQTGQLANLIRRETGFLIEKRILRYDGLPMTPEYIRRNLAD